MVYIMMMNIYLTNLGKYNEGELIGEWVQLPISNEELQEVFKRIGINKEYEEYFITDYECDFYEIGEYESISTLNEIAEKLDDLDEAIEKAERGDYRIYSNCDNMTDVAYAVVEECDYLRNVPENIARYFDYEAFGRDLGIEGSFHFLDNGDCIEIIG